MRRSTWFVVVLGCCCAAAAVAQRRPTHTAPPNPHQQFVLDAVRSAVALPQPDPQDRLRVLHSAINVVSPVSAQVAQSLFKEGVQLEAELIRAGEKPAVSMFDAGRVDCTAAANFVQSLPADAVTTAEQSLLSAIGSCPSQVAEPERQKIDAALSRGVVAPRALLAAIDATGASTAWSRSAFSKAFSSLPKDDDAAGAEVQDFAALYTRMAGEVDKDAARDAGLNFLEWLSKLSDSGERTLAINMVTDEMKRVLGDEKYEEALRGNVVAAGVARSAGSSPEFKRPEEDSVSVLEAMQNAGQDQTDALRALPPAKRAKQAAADAFAAGNAGDRTQAEHYLNIAFSAADEVWKQRGDHPNAPAIVEEVSDAAAHVDSVAALTRAQHLQDPTAQAIGMLAVARTVLGEK